MNVPNGLTVLRFLLTVLFIWAVLQDGLMMKVGALVIFTLAALTDFLDGYYARKHDLITRFGKMMDPIADKFLILSAFFIFARVHIFPIWIFAIILVREVAVTGLRLAAMRRGAALAAERAGKLKTVLQIVAVYLIMIFIIFTQASQDSVWHRTVVKGFFMGIHGWMGGVVLVTVWSGLSFVWNNRKEIFRVR